MIEPVISQISNPPSPAELFSILQGRPFNFFLDSSSDPKKLGRFSFLGCDPFLVFKSKKDFITLEWQGGNVENFNANPFAALKDLLARYRIQNEIKWIPFVSGCVGYFSYDLKDFVEKLPDIAKDDLDLPDCILGFYDCVIVYDNLNSKTYLASSGLPEVDPVRNRERSLERLNEFKNIISSGPVLRNDLPLSSSPVVRSNFSKISYERAVKKAKEYIAKGDIYQVNLSQRLEADLDVEPSELYMRLRSLSPAPFSSYLDFKDIIIASSSPERFLMKRGDYIETRPIKGTRPRGHDDSGDALLADELIHSRKDAAEHIMIVDLERNDLGRVCEYGSVMPAESMILEKYANVFHLVSTVSGRLKKGIDPIDCLLAAFPGGSITGAPKIRSMEIIEELEPVKRSIYTGAIGYISFDGNMDTSIVIRTFVIKDKKAYFQVGGGIVADSDPEKEYEETLHKAQGLMQALNVSRPRKLAYEAGRIVP